MLLAVIRDDNLAAPFHQALGLAETDTGCAARDEGDLARKIFHN